MKCQQCAKEATFHITDITGSDGPIILHLCEEHFRAFASQDSKFGNASVVAGALAKQLNLEQTAEQLAALDEAQCPSCGITFAEFRQGGRFGCPYDYVCFEDSIEPLLVNIHGARQHLGKHPRRTTGRPDEQHRLIQLRKEMKQAIEREDYEAAGSLRDQIREMEQKFRTSQANEEVREES